MRSALLLGALLVACGTARIDNVEAEGDGGGGGGAAGGGGSAGSPSSCPAEIPDTRTACDQVDLQCPYRQGACDVVALCAAEYGWDPDVFTWMHVPPEDGSSCSEPGAVCTDYARPFEDGVHIATAICSADGWVVNRCSDVWPYLCGGCPSTLPANGAPCVSVEEGPDDEYYRYDHCAYPVESACGVQVATIFCDVDAFAVTMPTCP